MHRQQTISYTCPRYSELIEARLCQNQPMTLRELAAREAHCRREMDRVQKAVSVSDRVAAENWAEVELREIHHLYSALAMADSADSLEALKRGLFLTWFECAEPSYVTGIRNLDGAASVAFMDRLEEEITSMRADRELSEMLAYYAQVAKWCLDRFQMGVASRAGAGRSPSLKFLTSDVQPATYQDRGLMGDYFLSLRPNATQ